MPVLTSQHQGLLQNSVPVLTSQHQGPLQNSVPVLTSQHQGLLPNSVPITTSQQVLPSIDPMLRQMQISNEHMQQTNKIPTAQITELTKTLNTFMDVIEQKQEEQRFKILS